MYNTYKINCIPFILELDYNKSLNRFLEMRGNMYGQDITIKISMTNNKKGTLRKELLRKSIHMLTAFVPFFASKNLLVTTYVVVFGMIFYVTNEFLHSKGKRGFFIVTKITEMASRERDKGHFVLGPLTLALGVFLSLLFFPHPASSLAIFSLAFGDGLASLVGKKWGRTVMPFLQGKTLEGSLACFGAVYISSYFVLNSKYQAFLVAIFSTFLEAIPLKDYDNVIIPLGTGLFSLYMLGMI